jgi:predicted nucleotidyltransferase
MKIRAEYPTAEHEKAAKAIVEFFSVDPDAKAVILYGSCARGKAAPGSCLDIMVLVMPDVLSAKKNILEEKWNTYYQTEAVFKNMLALGKYSHVDLDFIDGCFEPHSRGWTSGPDEFELEIGNTLAYSVPLWTRGDYFNQLKDQWLPYYDENLRQTRLSMVLQYCKNNLDHIPLYVNRQLYFQSFNRLYDALREFIQALFISRRTYPIAYDKWIKEQIEDILALPELYPVLVNIMEITPFESQEISEKARILTQLIRDYIQ